MDASGLSAPREYFMSDSTHGIVLQNAGSGSLDGGIATFGQVFLRGDVPAGAELTAQGGGLSLPVQMDVKTRYEDGSVKMAVLAVQRPAIAPGESLELALTAGPATSGAAAINLNAALSQHTFLVEMKIAGGSTVQVDVMDALRDALADGSASFWQSGPLATQARVAVDLPGAQRLVFDVTAFKGGGMTVEAQFNNDKAMGASGGRVQYDLTVTMDGVKVATETVSQGQYQNWHRTFSSNDHDGGQGLGSPSEGWLNIRHDVEYLSKTGAIAAYDTSLSISDTLINKWAAAQSEAAWSAPLSANGITQYMPMTGGRGDIGITTAGNTAWLLSGDPYAAGYAMGQAEAASAIPWHFWNAQKDTWINSADFPKLWTDARGGTGKVGDANATGLTQQVPNDTGWTPDRAHQPSVSFVPYLLTGERWILDNLQAQANFTVISLWPAVRTEDGAFIAPQQQARSVAWSIREVQNAAWSSPDGSPEKAYLQGVADANWKWLVEQIPAWTALQGEAHGWVPNVGGAGIDLAPWQQDYLASTAIAAASRGSEDAMTFLKWQMNFLIGRFQSADNGFALRDGAAYIIAVGDGSNVYQSWAEIGAATAARGWSNGTDSWQHSNGDYARLALMTLAGIYGLTGSQDAYDAYKALLAEKPPNVSESTFAGNPNHAVTIPELYGSGAGTGGTPIIAPAPPAPSPPEQPSEPAPPVVIPVAPPAAAPPPASDTLTLSQTVQGDRIDLGAGSNNTLNLSSAGANKLTVLNAKTINGGKANDDVTLATTITNGRIDLGGGSDKLTLSSSGANKLVVLNTETIIGGTGNDDVTLGTTFAGGTVDLGEGQDRLVLADGSNRITVANTETIIGGSGHDDVTLSSAVSNGTIDLGAGSDKLMLSSAGANKLTVLNTETITGGTANDEVILGTAITNGRIDLGGGSDKLTLSSAGANRLTVLNTETITGGTADDDVILGTAITNGRIDLGGGNDKLTLSSSGGNTLLVLNVA
ncbi:MAG: calcium-binding protein, partial [Falsiroseomonas sp.]|nr:calcium-binding protein [Falsiroseomonas sp.]